MTGEGVDAIFVLVPATSKPSPVVLEAEEAAAYREDAASVSSRVRSKALGAASKPERIISPGFRAASLCQRSPKFPPGRSPKIPPPLRFV